MACGDMTWPENNEANYNSSRSGQLEFFENAIGYFLNSDSSWIRFIPSVPDSSGDHDIELGLADDGQGRAVVRRNKFSGYDTPPVTDKEVFLLDKNGNTAVENLLISSGHNYEDALAISYNATDETKAPKFSFNTLNFLLPASYTASNPPNETLATREYIQNAALQFDNYTHGAQFRVGSLNEQTAGSVDNWTKNNDSLIPGYYIFNANDDFVFLVGGGESDQGYGILGTGDNGNEPIYVAQFNTTGDWGNKSVNEIGNANRYITLLDKNGYTVLNHLISPQFALGSEGSDLFYYKNDNPSVYGLGFNINGAAVNDRGVLIDQSKALLRFNSPDFSFILGDAGKSENNRGYRYISFADSSFGSMSNDQAINVASENYVQNYSQKKQTYT